MVVETRLRNFGMCEVLCEIRTVLVNIIPPSCIRGIVVGAYLNSLSSSITWMPFSNPALPFCPADAKWPFTAMFSGAVYDLLMFGGRLDASLDGTEDIGGEAALDAMMTSF